MFLFKGDLVVLFFVTWLVFIYIINRGNYKWIKKINKILRKSTGE